MSTRVAPSASSGTPDGPTLATATQAELEQFHRVIGEAFDRANRSLSRLEVHARELATFGWILPPWFPPQALPQIVREAERLGFEALDAGMVSEYRKKFGSRYKTLKRLLLKSRTLASWHPLLKQCFRAYERRDFAIAVPSLLLILEGVVNALDATSRAKVDPKAVAARQRARAQQGIERLLWVSLESFIRQVFSSSDGRNKPRIINRHWVLHGRDSSEWGPAECLRILVALEVLLLVLRDYRDRVR